MKRSALCLLFVLSLFGSSPAIAQEPILTCHFENQTLVGADGEVPAGTSGTFTYETAVGQGLLIDGSDRLAYWQSGNFDPDRGAIEMWIKPTWDGDTDNQYVFFNEYTEISGSARAFWLFKDDADSKLKFRITEGGSSHETWHDVSDWSAGELHHILATWDSGQSGGQDACIRLYVDGALSGEWEPSGFDAGGPLGKIYIGCRYNPGDGEQADSVIDELKIYDEFMTPGSPSPIIECKFDGSLTGEDGETPDRSSGLTYQTGVDDQGVLIEGSDTLSYASYGNFNPKRGAVEFWVQPTWDGDTDNQYLFLNEYYYLAGGDDRAFWLFKDDSTSVLTFRINSGSSAWQVIHDVTDWNASEWHQVLAAWDTKERGSGDGRLRLYVDDVLESELVVTDGIAFDIDEPAQSIYFGCRFDNSLERANAVIDDFKIYGDFVTPDSQGPILECLFEDTPFGSGGEVPTKQSGISYTDGKVDRGVLIDGSDALAYSTSGNFDPDKGSIEFWVRPDWNGSDGNQYVFFNELYLVGAPNDRAFWLYKDDTTNELRFRLDPGAASYHEAAHSVTDWVEDEWHHVLATWDTGQTGVSNAYIRLYIDGVKEHEVTPSPFEMGAAADTFYFGCRNDAASEQANAIMDEFRIYDRVLSSSPVAYKIEKGSYTLWIHSGGGLTIETGGELFKIATKITSPDCNPEVYFNKLLPEPADARSYWLEMSVAEVTGGTTYYKVTAEHPTFKLERHITPDDTETDGFLEIDDYITTFNNETIGLKISNYLTNDSTSDEVYVYGSDPDYYSGLMRASQNPTVFFKKSAMGLGLVAEDDISRVHLWGDEEGLHISDPISVRPSSTRTLNWSVYTGAGYFDFINKVRDDWGLNYEITGYSEGTVDDYYSTDTTHIFKTVDGGCVTAFMRRRGTEAVAYSHLRVLAGSDAGPICLDAYGDDTYNGGTPEDYLSAWVAESIRGEDPNAKVIVPIHPGFSIDSEADSDYPDSVANDENGDQHTEYNSTSDYQQTRYAFFATETNSWGDVFSDVIDMVFDPNVIDADGIFFDQADGVLGYDIYYIYSDDNGDISDGSSAVLTSAGAFDREIAALPLLTMDFTKNMVEYIGSIGKSVYLNNGPRTKTMTDTIADYYFSVQKENTRDSNNDGVPEDPPPDSYYSRIASTHLSNPVMRTSLSDFGKQTICNDVINYLDHGVLTIPVTSTVLGEDTIFSFLYPITIDEIGEGFVKGEDKLVVSKARTYTFGDGSTPMTAFYFDNECDYVSEVDLAAASQVTVSFSGETCLAVVMHNPELVCHLPMNEDDCGDPPTTIFDTTVYANDGYVYSGTWDDGISDSGVSFNGSTDYVNCGDDASLASGSFTAVAWIYHTAYTDMGDAVLGCSKWANPPGHFTEGYVMRFWQSDTAFKYILGSSSAQQTVTTTIPLDTWYFVAMTYDSATSTFKAYKNDSLVDTKTSAAYTAPTRALRIGRDHTNANDVYFHGIIDEVSIYNRALSLSELTEIYELYAN